MRAALPFVLLAAVACDAPAAAVRAMPDNTSTTRPAAGQAAPGFSAPASTGKTVALSDYQGKQTVVLAFFPKAFTGG